MGNAVLGNMVCFKCRNVFSVQTAVSVALGCKTAQAKDIFEVIKSSLVFGPDYISSSM